MHVITLVMLGLKQLSVCENASCYFVCGHFMQRPQFAAKF